MNLLIPIDNFYKDNGFDLFLQYLKYIIGMEKVTAVLENDDFYKIEFDSEANEIIDAVNNVLDLCYNYNTFSYDINPYFTYSVEYPDEVSYAYIMKVMKKATNYIKLEEETEEYKNCTWPDCDCDEEETTESYYVPTEADLLEVQKILITLYDSRL